MQNMGVKNYRFSVAWPRIFPNGIGQPNAKGLDFYRRLSAEILEPVRKPRHYPRMLSLWHLLGPEVMYWAPRQMQSLWKTKEIYITENGCAASDELSADGTVDDSDRIMFLRNHLAHLHRATAEGVPVK